METSFSLPEEMEKPTHWWGQAILSLSGHQLTVLAILNRLATLYLTFFLITPLLSVSFQISLTSFHLRYKFNILLSPLSFPCPTYTSSRSYGTITPTGLIQQLSLCLRNNSTNIHGVISQKIIIFSILFTIPCTFQLQTTKLQDSKSVKLHC